MRLVRRARPALAVVAVVLAVTASGCSGPAVPQGWDEHQVGSLTVAYPDGWVELPAGDIGGELWQRALQDAEGGDATVQLLLGPDFSDDDRAGAAADRLVAAAQIGIPFEGWTTSGRTDIDVPGATSAERWDFSYDGQEGDTVSGVWVFVADEEAGRAAAVQLTGTPLDEDLVFGVVSSLRLDPDAAPVDGAEEA